MENRHTLVRAGRDTRPSLAFENDDDRLLEPPRINGGVYVVHERPSRSCSVPPPAGRARTHHIGRINEKHCSSLIDPVRRYGRNEDRWRSAVGAVPWFTATCARMRNGIRSTIRATGFVLADPRASRASQRGRSRRFSRCRVARWDSRSVRPEASSLATKRRPSFPSCRVESPPRTPPTTQRQGGGSPLNCRRCALSLRTSWPANSAVGGGRRPSHHPPRTLTPDRPEQRWGGLRD